jgi:hypothetical protein
MPITRWMILALFGTSAASGLIGAEHHNDLLAVLGEAGSVIAVAGASKSQDKKAISITENAKGTLTVANELTRLAEEELDRDVFSCDSAPPTGAEVVHSPAQLPEFLPGQVFVLGTDGGLKPMAMLENGSDATHPTIKCHPRDLAYEDQCVRFRAQYPHARIGVEYGENGRVDVAIRMEYAGEWKIYSQARSLTKDSPTSQVIATSRAMQAMGVPFYLPHAGGIVNIVPHAKDACQP